MKIVSSHGQFKERPYFHDRDIELMAGEELGAVDLLPTSPEAIRIERFVEKRFGVTPDYAELPAGVLGYTRFGANGVEGIVVSRSLTESGSRVSERRVNTTLAHEAGHGLMHAHLFVLESFNYSLFNDPDATPGKILCRDPGTASVKSGYDGRWWEFQANRMMAALLLPGRLVVESLEPFFVTHGSLGARSIPGGSVEDAARLLADVFDVNPVVARYRIQGLGLVDGGEQLTL